MTLRWSKDAQNDLTEAESFLAERNATAAQKLVQAAVAASAFLQQHPQAGPVVPGRGLSKWHVPRTRYLLLYRTTGRDVRIVRMMHDARHWIRFV